ncbi:hypothetical protein QR98_0047520 [Sarcoptes scabiei]|uniref:Uncharacterized protein n=1 Tax=Sarcoptes scabiei TaxID=52283 RepID=A0A132A5N8_SARSC|nr:hypothetical protein QR98_0047520 [Sarcoptes scabiei]
MLAFVNDEADDVNHDAMNDVGTMATQVVGQEMLRIVVVILVQNVEAYQFYEEKKIKRILT